MSTSKFLPAFLNFLHVVLAVLGLLPSLNLGCFLNQLTVRGLVVG